MKQTVDRSDAEELAEALEVIQEKLEQGWLKWLLAHGEHTVHTALGRYRSKYPKEN